jgi:hypothetical protein
VQVEVLVEVEVGQRLFARGEGREMGKRIRGGRRGGREDGCDGGPLEPALASLSLSLSLCSLFPPFLPPLLLFTLPPRSLTFPHTLVYTHTHTHLGGRAQVARVRVVPAEEEAHLLVQLHLVHLIWLAANLHMQKVRRKLCQWRQGQRA